ncbi:MAG: hypothetical protein JNG83_10910 [Opitutaceae bacterium]|nr:hypothetical protein [Opitutaceae bacterium]
MKRLPFLVLALVLGGCTTPAMKDPAAADAPSATAPAVATLTPSPASRFDFFLGHDVECRIETIDGIALEKDPPLTPGKHRLLVVLQSAGKEFVGEVDLVIPAARQYQLKAKRKDDAFTVSLVDTETSAIIATSTAPAAARMKFLVFVVQH